MHCVAADKSYHGTKLFKQQNKQGKQCRKVYFIDILKGLLHSHIIKSNEIISNVDIILLKAIN